MTTYILHLQFCNLIYYIYIPYLTYYNCCNVNTLPHKIKTFFFNCIESKWRLLLIPTHQTKEDDELLNTITIEHNERRKNLKNYKTNFFFFFL